MPAPPDAPWKAWSLERDAALKGDAEAIHRLRVAANRLRAAFRLSGSTPPPALLKLARALGRVRGWDRHLALLKTLRCDPDTWPDRAHGAALRHVLQERRLALEALKRPLRASPFLVCDPPPLPPLSRHVEDLRGLARGTEGTMEALHELRRALRDLRYALEWRAPGDPFLAPLKKLAWTLGLHRDWLLCEDFIERRRKRWARQGRRRLAAGAEALREAAAIQRREVEAALAPLAKSLLEAHRAKKGPKA